MGPTWYSRAVEASSGRQDRDLYSAKLEWIQARGGR
jgi:hypothetical protein